MTTDVTSLTGITRVQSNSNSVNRAPNNVVPINNDVSSKPPVETQEKQFNKEDIDRAASKVNNFVADRSES